jgi:hypothetical protein
MIGWVISWPVKGRKRDRYRQTDEDPRLSFRLSEQCNGNHCRNKNRFLHILLRVDVKLDPRLRRSRSVLLESSSFSFSICFGTVPGFTRLSS